MTDVEERPVDGPAEGLVELSLVRKISDTPSLVDVVAQKTWMSTMLIWKGDEMLTCVITTQTDVSDLLGLIADGEFLGLDALDVCVDDLLEVEQGCFIVLPIVGCKGCLPVGPDQEAVDRKNAVLKKPRKRCKR